MTFDIIRLRFDTPLHLSNARPDDYGTSLRTLHSDTFTAAIFQAWAMLGRPDWIPQAADQPPGFAVSSLFPFHGNQFAGTEPGATDGEPVYFLPKPYFRNQTEQPGGLETGDAKKYKKVQFVDVPHFEAYLHQTALPSVGTEGIRGPYQSSLLAQLSPKKTQPNPDEKDVFVDFMAADVQTRLVKPRDESEPTPYYIERIHFRFGSGLWCLIQYESDETRRRVEAAVRYLADSGLGTDRTVGNGQFTPAFDTLPLRVPAPGRFAVSLSLFCPQDHAQLTAVLADPRTRYDIIRRGGWLSEPHNTYRKRSVWMFREGALLHCPGPPPATLGRLIDLRPDDTRLPTPVGHPVWRDGRTLLLPVNL